ncbi:MAG: FkbM family methyltransferase [Candidatus Rokubacteria bacterium]|nr:FkbM family methyltransferase [Candidatus Rokubacteria bacterium]
MAPIDRLIRMADKLPASWRERLWHSPLRPAVRRLLDLVAPVQLTVVPLARPLEGHRMRVNWRMQASYAFGTYEREVVQAVQAVIRPGWLAVDVGANVGYFTLLLAKLVGAQGRVIAFEPLPENFVILRENVRLNQYANVTLEQMAVTDRTGTLRLYRRREHLLTGSASIVHGPGDGIEVPATALDAYLEATGTRVGFVKIDVEGAEAAVLAGMRRVLAEDRPLVVVELDGDPSENQLTLSTLRRSGYRPRYLDEPPNVSIAHVLAEPGNRRERNYTLCGSPS